MTDKEKTLNFKKVYFKDQLKNCLAKKVHYDDHVPRQVPSGVNNLNMSVVNYCALTTTFYFTKVYAHLFNYN